MTRTTAQILVFGQLMEVEMRDGKFVKPDALKAVRGTGSALKPSVEDWWLCRKPLSEPSIAAQVLATGTGAINVDACRVGVSADDPNHRAPSIPFDKSHGNMVYGARAGGRPYENLSPQGRFPSHLLLSHHPDCRKTGTRRVKAGVWNAQPVNSTPGSNGKTMGNGWRNEPGETPGFVDADGMELVDDYICDEKCPIRLLDDQAGVRKVGTRTRTKTNNSAIFGNGHSDAIVGTAEGYDDGSNVSRFFTTFPPEPFEPDPDALMYYCSKASRRDRNSGLDNLVKMRDDLTDEQRAYVMAELKAAGVLS